MDSFEPKRLSLEDIQSYISSLTEENPQFRTLREFHAIISNKDYDENDPNSLKYVIDYNIVGTCIAASMPELYFEPKESDGSQTFLRSKRTYNIPSIINKFRNYYNRMSLQGINIYKIK